MLYTLAITTGSAIFQEPGAQRGVRACAERAGRERDARAPWSARERADRGRRATASCARGCALAVAHAMAVGVPAVGAEASSTPPLSLSGGHGRRRGWTGNHHGEPTGVPS